MARSLANYSTRRVLENDILRSNAERKVHINTALLQYFFQLSNFQTECNALFTLKTVICILVVKMMCQFVRIFFQVNDPNGLFVVMSNINVDIRVNLEKFSA